MKKADASQFVSAVASHLSGEEKRANKSGFLAKVRHHLPSIRLPDSIVGTTAGALGGLGLAGLRDVLSDDEKEDDKRYGSYLLGGALGGFGLGNLVGDRARRYIANNAPPFGYSGRVGKGEEADFAKSFGVKNPSSPAGWLPPRSWDQFYRTAILDRPSADMLSYIMDKKGPGLSPMPAMARIELLRRHMGLPVRPEDALFQSVGKRTFIPTTTNEGSVMSGGVAGKREHLEFAKDLTDKWLQPGGYDPKEKDVVPSDKEKFVKAIREGKSIRQAIADHGGKYYYGPAGFNWSIQNLKDLINTPTYVPSVRQRLVQPVEKVELPSRSGVDSRTTYKNVGSPETIQQYTGMEANPELEKHLIGGVMKPFGGIFARHGTEIDPQQGTGRVFDHWDFALSPGEEALLKQYLKLDKKTLNSVRLPHKLRRDLAGSTGEEGVMDWTGGGYEVQNPTLNDHKRDLLKRWVLNEVMGAGGPVVDQKFYVDENNNIRPLSYDERQSQRGLERLKGHGFYKALLENDVPQYLKDNKDKYPPFKEKKGVDKFKFFRSGAKAISDQFSDWKDSLRLEIGANPDKALVPQVLQYAGTKNKNPFTGKPQLPLSPALAKETQLGNLARAAILPRIPKALGGRVVAPVASASLVGSQLAPTVNSAVDVYRHPEKYVTASPLFQATSASPDFQATSASPDGAPFEWAGDIGANFVTNYGSDLTSANLRGLLPGGPNAPSYYPYNSRIDSAVGNTMYNYLTNVAKRRAAETARQAPPVTAATPLKGLAPSLTQSGIIRALGDVTAASEKPLDLTTAAYDAFPQAYRGATPLDIVNDLQRSDLLKRLNEARRKVPAGVKLESDRLIDFLNTQRENATNEGRAALDAFIAKYLQGGASSE